MISEITTWTAAAFSLVHAAKDDAERDRVWNARRAAFGLAKLKPTVVLEDATVPRSKIPAMIHAHCG